LFEAGEDHSRSKGAVFVRFPSQNGGQSVLSVVQMPTVTCALLVLAVQCTGCAYSQLGERQFSPDSSKVAYVREDVLTLSKIPHTGIPDVRQTACICWWSGSDPNAHPCVRIDSVSPRREGDHLRWNVHIQFSPGSRYLAVASPKGLSCVDLESGRVGQLSRPGELVTSMAWLDDDEIGYAAHTNPRGDYGMVTDRSFWRQKVQPAKENRALILRETGIEPSSMGGLCSSWPGECWSPQGRFVVYRQGPARGRFHLLDVASAEVQEFGRENSYSCGVFWKPDGSGVACFSQVKGSNRRLEALLVNPTSGEVCDFTEPFTDVFGPDAYGFDVDAFWTTDGEYLVNNDTQEHGGCLVRPCPWEIIFCARRLGEQVPAVRDESASYFQFARLAQYPVKGWFVANIYGRGVYLVNYEGTSFARASTRSYLCSPDGQYTASIDVERNEVDVRKADPELPQAASAPCDQVGKGQ
jgi:hypothetical protein